VRSFRLADSKPKADAFLTHALPGKRERGGTVRELEYHRRIRTWLRGAGAGKIVNDDAPEAGREPFSTARPEYVRAGPVPVLRTATAAHFNHMWTLPDFDEAK